MKFLVSLLVLTISLNISAAEIAYHMGRLENRNTTFCPEYVLGPKYGTAYCKVSNSKEVIQAKIGSELTAKETEALSAAGIYLLGPVDIGLVPDDGSDIAYSYNRWLVNSTGKKVGILSIDGWYSERDSARFYVRYNLQGKAVTITAEDGLRD